MAELRPVSPALPALGPALEAVPSPNSAVASLDGALHCPSCGARYPAGFKVCPQDATPLESAPAESDDTLVGQKLHNTYEVLRVIGEGGMGRVYEARHLRLSNKRFALKLLHPEFSRQPDVVTRFQREAEAASALSHPNVVSVYDVNTAPDGRPYLVAELLEGEQLGDLLTRRGKLPVAEAVRIVRQIPRALAAAHDHGIVHRDVKPENVFLVDGGNLVKVLDFGISKLGHGSEKLTKTGTVMGTPDYMAPEQARGDRVDSRADVYAVGALLYRALTGRKPFIAADPMATLTAVLTQEPPRPTAVEGGIPLGLELVIQRAMAKKPEERYQDMRELERALAPFAAAERTLVSGVAPEADAQPTLLEGHAPPSSGRLDSATGLGVRFARPGLVVFSALGFLWLFGNTIAAIVAALTLLEKRELTETEAHLVLAVGLAVLATPLVLWIRHIARSVWPSTPRALEALRRVKWTVLYSASAYGICSLGLVLFQTLIEHESARLADPTRWPGSVAAALVVFALAFALTHPRSKAAGPERPPPKPSRRGG